MKKIITAFFFVLILLTLSGCWSRKEPKTLAIAESGLFDKKENGNYELTTEILNPFAIGSVKTGGSSKNPSFIIKSEGISIPETLRNSTKYLDKSNFGGHAKARLFTERFVKNDMTDLIDFLLRESLGDENPMMFVIKDENPDKIYSSIFGLSDTLGGYLYNISKSQPKILSQGVFIKTLQFIKDYYNDGKQPVMGLIQLIELDPVEMNQDSSSEARNNSEKKYKILCDGLAAFKDNTLVGYFNAEEARAYNFITNDMKSTLISLKIDKDFTVFKINASKTKIKTKSENDQIMIDVNISVDTSIIQEAEPIQIDEAKPLKMIEEIFNKNLEEEISMSVKKAQVEFQSDIFGFGSQFHIDHPKEWKEIKENWDEKFSAAKINITVDSVVNRTGLLKEPFIVEE